MSITNLSMNELIEIITQQYPRQSTDLKSIFSGYINKTFKYNPIDDAKSTNNSLINTNNNVYNDNANNKTIQRGYTYVEKRF